jgi:pimeloyl-ACP methyl ester carboxylesterase
MNRRGFGASTVYGQEELKLLDAPATRDEPYVADAARNHNNFIEGRALELAHFLCSLKTRLGTEKMVLLGWSLGNFFCLKLLEMIQNGSLHDLGDEVETMLKGFIMYGKVIPVYLYQAVMLRFHRATILGTPFQCAKP